MLPREKIEKYGVKKLESWELIATILGTGTKGQDVFVTAKKAAKCIETKQDSICVEDLLQIKGIGKVKGLQILAGFELARRHFFRETVTIQSSKDVLHEVEKYRKKKQEYLLSLTLDGAGNLIQKRVITIGILDESLAHPREIFSSAIEDRAHSLILVHNHPSGNVTPSQTDIRTTKRVSDVGRLVGIQLKDHIIIASNDHYSFAENALI